MTATERSQQLTLLHHMQREYESLTRQQGGVIMVTAPGTITKHVYSGKLATKISRAIARTLEQERFQIINAKD